MHSTRHSWATEGMFPGRRPGSVLVIVVCRYCNLVASATAGSAPLRTGACTGERPPAPPIVWAARRDGPHARLFWHLR